MILKLASKKFGELVALNLTDQKLIDRGFVSLRGDSGSGKTTFVNCLSGMDQFTESAIEVNGRTVVNFDGNCAFIFQDFQLIERYSVRRNLQLVCDMYRLDEKQIDFYLDKLNIADLAEKRVRNLSAGQRQRVAVARALLLDKPIVIADEPIANLDAKNAEIIVQTLKDISANKLVILISHENINRDELFDQMITIADGEFTENRIVNDNQNGIKLQTKEPKLSLKNKVKLAGHFARKQKQSIFSVILLFLSLTIVSLVLNIALCDEATQRYKVYQSQNQLAVGFSGMGDRGFQSYYDENNLFTNEIKYVAKLNNYNAEFLETQVLVDQVWYGPDEKIAELSGGEKLENYEAVIASDLAAELAPDSDIVGKQIEVPGVTLTVKKLLPANFGYKKSMLVNEKTFQELAFQSASRQSSYLCVNFTQLKNEVYSCVDIKSDADFGVELADDEVAIASTSRIGYIKDVSNNSPLEISSNNTNNFNKFIFNKLKVLDLGSNEQETIVVSSKTLNALIYYFSGFSFFESINGYAYVKPDLSDFRRSLNNGAIDFSPISRSITGAIDYAHSWNGIFLWIGLVMIAIAAVVIASTMSASVNINKRESGVLLALGTRRRTLYSLYFLQAMIYCAMSVLLTVISGIVEINIFDHSLKVSEQINFSVYFYLWYLPFIILIASVIVTLISLSISFLKINKKSNVDIIYER